MHDELSTSKHTQIPENADRPGILTALTNSELHAMHKKIVLVVVGALLIASPLVASAQMAAPSSNTSLIAALTALVQVLEQELQQLVAISAGTPQPPQPMASSTPINVATSSSSTAPLTVSAVQSPNPAAPASCIWNEQSIPSGSSVTGYQSSSVSAGSQCESTSLVCNDGTLSNASSYPYASCTVAAATIMPAATTLTPTPTPTSSGISSGTITATGCTLVGAGCNMRVSWSATTPSTNVTLGVVPPSGSEIPLGPVPPTDSGYSYTVSQPGSYTFKLYTPTALLDSSSATVNPAPANAGPAVNLSASGCTLPLTNTATPGGAPLCIATVNWTILDPDISTIDILVTRPVLGDMLWQLAGGATGSKTNVLSAPGTYTVKAYIGGSVDLLGTTTFTVQSASSTVSSLSNTNVASAIVAVQSFSDGSPPAGQPTSSSACVNLSNNLILASTDQETDGQVSELQQFLGIAPTTGYFGPLTEQAVQAWQSTHGIIASGSPETTGYGAVGPATRATMACR